MTQRKKLIEVALPLEAINVASAREKSIRHGHPSTLHLWWARRPLAAARAVIFTSLVDDPDDPNALPAFVEACKQLPKGKNVEANGDTPRMRLFDFIERLVTWEATTDEAILNTARELIQIATEGNPPPLLDPFAGGGSIPLEAQRLGLEAHASDLNPVAVMINKAQIEIPPRFANRPPVNPRNREKMFGKPLTPKSPLPQQAEVRGLDTEGHEGHERWHIPAEVRERMTEIARHLRKNATKSEDILWQAIRNRQVDGRKFKRQVDIGAFVLDFYCAEERLAVEVDGGIHTLQQDADQLRQELIESLGIRFVRLSAELVETNLPQALKQIQAAFKSQQQSSLPLSSRSVGEGPGVRGLDATAGDTPLSSRSVGEGAGGEGQESGGEGLWRGAAGLAADVRYYGEWMREKAWERIGHLYPPLTPKSPLPQQAEERGLDATAGDTPLSSHSVGEGPGVRGDTPLSSRSVGEGPGVRGETVIAWLWARTVKSPNPAVNAHVPLVRSFILSKKKGKECWAKPIVEPLTPKSPLPQQAEERGLDATAGDTPLSSRSVGEGPGVRGDTPLSSHSVGEGPGVRGDTPLSSRSVGEGPGVRGQTHTLRFEVTPGKPPKDQDGTMGRQFGGGRCIISGVPMSWDYIRDEGKAGRMGVMLMAIVTEGKNGRNYYSPNEWHEKVALDAKHMAYFKPSGEMPLKHRNFQPPVYGMYEYGDLFTPRQLVALTTFSDLVAEARAQAHADALSAGLPDDGVPLRDGGRGALAYAEAVSVYLAFAVDKGVDKLSTVASWDVSRDNIRNTFARQAIPMTWDYAEANLFSDSTGNWMSYIEWIWKTLENLPSSQIGMAIQQDAAELVTTAATISTDPPYCLAPGTLIYTPEGLKPIEVIQTGEQVLTHRGRFATVTRTYRHHHSGKIQRLKVAHSHLPLFITGEHPIYGVQTQACRVGYADYCYSECAWKRQNKGKCGSDVAHTYQLDWIPASEVAVGDQIFMPTVQNIPVEMPEAVSMLDYLPVGGYTTQEGILHYQKATARSLAYRAENPALPRRYQTHAEIELTPELCELVGYFVAEGYARVQHDGGTVQFTFHVAENHLHEAVKRLMQSCFGIAAKKVTDNRAQNNQSVRLNFYSKPVAELLRTWCYTDDGYKKLPDFVWSLSDDHLKALLKGYWSGDGSRSNHTYQAVSNSPYLIGQLRLILQRLDILAVLHTHTVKTTLVNGKPVKASGPQYSLHVAGTSLLKLAAIVGEPKREALKTKRFRTHGHEWEGGYLLPIREVETLDYEGEVYNLETEDHSYVTAAGCVHNCDNIGYADLSDFFYVWMRKSLRDVYPDIFATMLVPKAPELIASPYRHGGKEAAAEFFYYGLFDVFKNLRLIQKDDYPTTVYYAFKQQDDVLHDDDDDEDANPLITSTGWETVLNSLTRADFQVMGTWPIRTELSNRMVGMGTNALASSIVLVCRPRPDDAPSISRRAFLDTLRRELPAALKAMQSGNIAPVDLAQASIGPGMAIYSRYSSVLEADGSTMSVRTALGLINAALDEYLAEQDGDIDADTRFAIAWFEQFGFTEGEFGVADVLARAKNTSVIGVESAGLVMSGRGKVRLIHWTEYDPSNTALTPKSPLPQQVEERGLHDSGSSPLSSRSVGEGRGVRGEAPGVRGNWDPTQDKRPTVWEATHHLIERLNSHGETGSAMLMQKMPSDMAAEARQLAYRLYSICERKGWADHARDYNALVISWSGIGEEAARLRQAAESGDATTQERLFE